jgi:tetratricopeptide (TPR) repeat protein
VTANARAQLLEIARIHCERGDLEPAERLLAANQALRDNDNSENRTAFAALEARLLRAHGQAAEAFEAAERGLTALGELPITDTYIKAALVEAVEAALASGDLDSAERLLAVPETLDPGQLTPLLQAHTARLRARLDAARGRQDRIDEHFRSSASLYGRFGFTFHGAVAQLEHAESLTARNRGEEAQSLLVDAQRSFEGLRATPWLERTAQAVLTSHDPRAVVS